METIITISIIGGLFAGYISLDNPSKVDGGVGDFIGGAIVGGLIVFIICWIIYGIFQVIASYI